MIGHAIPGLYLADINGYIVQAGLLALEDNINFLPGVQISSGYELINSITVAGPHRILTCFPFDGIMPT